VVGPATADALARRHLVADLIPRRHLAEGLLQIFPPPRSSQAAVLFPRAAEGRDVLAEGLRAAGWEVDVVEAYRTVRLEVPDDLKSSVAKADAICFTSSSTVTGFIEACGLEAVPPVVACIGPVTAATASEVGIQVDAVAADQTIAGLVDAVLGAFTQ
jgi:uroporphyrinogen-III synthase